MGIIYPSVTKKSSWCMETRNVVAIILLLTKGNIPHLDFEILFKRGNGSTTCIVDCQFCDINRDVRGGVRWKCLNCDLNLCENCKTGRHSRIKDSNQHRIIDIQALRTESSPTLTVAEWTREMDLHKIVCLEHPNKTCYHFCKECKKPICPSCFLEHRDHNLIELELIYKDQQLRLKNIQREIDNDLQTLPGMMTMIIKEEEEISRNYDDVRFKIEQRESEIKVQATNDAKRLLKDLEEFRKTENTVIYLKFYEGRVVALNEGGHVKWTYKAHDMDKFNPCDIVTTSTGLVIITTDYYGNVVHILSENGDFLTKFGGDEVNISMVRCLNNDQEENLQIACNFLDHVEIMIAKIL
ncbi:uncharacterized protein LOC134710585 [Mytilus trossulus]|uniref:uncharacterized protein LOC134710585 n=1 Tax=Mytilus trossulus TaxID=6551 RepID=UPI0030042E18